MSAIPTPPSLPANAAALAANVAMNAEAWYNYLDKSIAKQQAEQQRLKSEGAVEALREELRARPADAAPSTRLSERLADLKPFQGVKSDFRRFENAIIQKWKLTQTGTRPDANASRLS
ncbi:MAG: hypothetical protein SEPTF4163_005041 [Sporothrix epigloea]